VTYRDLLKALVNLEESQLDSDMSVHDEFLDIYYNIVEFKIDDYPTIAFCDDNEELEELIKIPKKRETPEVL